MSSDLAYVNPQLLNWARERSGVSYEKLGHSLGVAPQQLRAWEDGDGHPPFAKAIRLAEVLRVPFGFLFLEKPPTLETPVPDLRTLHGEQPREPSVDFIDLLYEVLAKQDWYREYAEEHGAKPLTFVSSFSSRDSPEDVASDIRTTLGLEDDFRRNARTWADHLRLLCEAAESVGVLVMRSGVVGNNTHRPLSVQEFQGFAVTDEIAPLVFVNGQDYKSAQIFTLAHELAHIWIGKSGISKVNESEIVSLPKDGPFIRTVPPETVERLCNAIAAETLVPRAEFLAFWREPATEASIQKLARHFFVSTLVILRRAREFDKISVSQFRALLDKEREKRKETSSGGDYYRNVMARHGHTFTDAVLQDLRQGRTLYRDAAALLDMKVPALEKMVKAQ